MTARHQQMQQVYHAQQGHYSGHSQQVNMGTAPPIKAYQGLQYAQHGEQQQQHHQRGGESPQQTAIQRAEARAEAAAAAAKEVETEDLKVKDAAARAVEEAKAEADAKSKAEEAAQAVIEQLAADSMGERGGPGCF